MGFLDVLEYAFSKSSQTTARQTERLTMSYTRLKGLLLFRGILTKGCLQMLPQSPCPRLWTLGVCRHLCSVSPTSEGDTLKSTIHRDLDKLQVNQEAKHLNELLNQQDDTDTFGTLEPHKPKRKLKSKTRREDKWSETFGTLAEDQTGEEEDLPEHGYADDDNDKDPDEYRRLAMYGRKHRPLWYARRMEKLIKQNKLYEAVYILETTMLKEDRVKPTPYVFSVLISALGKVGYTKKAFMLYNMMKKYHIKVPDHIYTSLFNACANSPWKEDGLSRTKKLYEQLIENEYVISSITYKSIIKSFGMCGDVLQAFCIVDEMEAKGLPADEQVFSFLFFACVSDKEAGLKHGVEVWRRMLKRGIKPQLHHYNLLLRTIHECGVGDKQYADSLIRKIRPLPGVTMETGSTETMNTIGAVALESGVEINEYINDNHSDNLNIDNSNLIVQQDDLHNQQDDMHIRQNNDSHTPWWKYDPGWSHPISDIVENTTGRSDTLMETLSEKTTSLAFNNNVSIATNTTLDVPNILHPRGKLSHIVELGDLNTPTKRFGLFGGLRGFLTQMNRSEVTPDVKIFTQILSVTPHSGRVEDDILGVMREYGVQPDVDMYNLIIRRRALRKDSEGAKELLSQMAASNMLPNTRTFGCLAIGCKKKSEGLALLEDMETLGIRPPIEIFNILMLQTNQDFSYKMWLCKAMTENEVLPDEDIIRKIEGTIRDAKKITVQRESGKKVHPFFASDYFIHGFRDFMLFYKTWLINTDYEKTKHPWEQYRKPANVATETVT